MYACRALPDTETLLRHNMEITFHSGAAESYGRLRLLEGDELLPGEITWAQIELREPVAVTRGDHYIIRRPSPSITLGGGVILDPTPRRRHRRRRPELFSRFEMLLQGEPGDILEGIIAREGPLTSAQALAATDLPAEQAQDALDELLAVGRVQPLDASKPAGPLIAPNAWAVLRARLQDQLADYHRTNPLRQGMPREELKSRLQPRSGWPTRLFNVIVSRAAAEGMVRELGLVPGIT